MFARTLRRLVILALVVITAPLLAARADTRDDAEKYAGDLGNNVLAVVTDQKLSDDQKEAKLQALFEQSVDLDWIGKFVLGKYWRTASEDQQRQYLANYRTYLVKTYTSKFKEYSGQTFNIISTHQEDDGSYVVAMEIVQPEEKRKNNEPNVSVNYRVRPKGSGFKVYDIVVESISMITTQREEFTSVVSRKGLDYLIQQLAKRAAAPENAQTSSLE